MSGHPEPRVESRLERVIHDATEPPEVELYTVRLLGTPLELWARASEHSQELMREFALIALDRGGATVPRRLLQLITDIRARYGGDSGADEQARAVALAAGRQTLDLVYRVPLTLRQACLDLDRLLDEADEYCATDAYLLTLAAPQDTVAFRRWFLAEFVRQLDGEEPRPWPGPTG